MTGTGSVLQTPLSTHQVLIRCLLQEHPSRSLSLMPCMPWLSPVEPDELFDLIWSIPPCCCDLAWAAHQMMLCLSVWPHLQPCTWGSLWKGWRELEFSPAGEEAEFSSHGLCENSDQQVAVLRRRSCCSLKWWGTSFWLQAVGARGVGWVSPGEWWCLGCFLSFAFLLAVLHSQLWKTPSNSQGCAGVNLGILVGLYFPCCVIGDLHPTMLSKL